MTSVVCFDIGIKNLAYCQLKEENKKLVVLEWENVNLMEEKAQPKRICYGCSSKATYEGSSCSRHTLKPALIDSDGKKFKKIPPVKTLLEIVLQKEPITKKSTKKEELLEIIRKYYALPLQGEKAVKAVGVDLCFLHDRIRELVLKHKDAWSGVVEICLENQPVFKNPQMKSVQMVLFATLRDLLQPNPPLVRFVHAGGKVKGATKGDEGYAERKKGSEDRVKEAIRTGAIDGQFRALYEAASKKNDLADAFCMAVDAVNRLR